MTDCKKLIMGFGYMVFSLTDKYNVSANLYTAN